VEGKIAGKLSRPKPPPQHLNRAQGAIHPGFRMEAAQKTGLILVAVHALEGTGTNNFIPLRLSARGQLGLASAGQARRPDREQFGRKSIRQTDLL